MINSLKNIENNQIEANDGNIGKVYTIFFDDQSWEIRYLVVDTSYWLPGRKVLISPSVLGKSIAENTFPVELTKEQIQNSPDIDTQKPVSRQQQIELFEHYGWVPYWDAAYGPIASPYMPAALPNVLPGEDSQDKVSDNQNEDDPHLRNAKEVLGYNISALNGEIGHIEDILFENESWEIKYLVVDTRNWLPGKKVIIPPLWVEYIRWSESQLNVKVTRETVKNSPEYNWELPLDFDYEKQLFEHYQKELAEIS